MPERPAVASSSIAGGSKPVSTTEIEIPFFQNAQFRTTEKKEEALSNRASEDCHS